MIQMHEEALVNFIIYMTSSPGFSFGGSRNESLNII